MLTTCDVATGLPGNSRSVCTDMILSGGASDRRQGGGVSGIREAGLSKRVQVRSESSNG